MGPIDISSQLWPGANQAQIGLVDTGGYLASSTLYLVTNCTRGGYRAGQHHRQPDFEQQSDRPATDPELYVQFLQQPAGRIHLRSFRGAELRETIDYRWDDAFDSGHTLDPANFQSTYLKGTSFATANCLIHTGELYNNSPACKLYTVTCQVGTNPSQSGVLCPVSQRRNEIFQEISTVPALPFPIWPAQTA